MRLKCELLYEPQVNLLKSSPAVLCNLRESYSWWCSKIKQYVFSHIQVPFNTTACMNRDLLWCTIYIFFTAVHKNE